MSSEVRRNIIFHLATNHVNKLSSTASKKARTRPQIMYVPFSTKMYSRLWSNHSLLEWLASLLTRHMCLFNCNNSRRNSLVTYDIANIHGDVSLPMEWHAEIAAVNETKIQDGHIHFLTANKRRWCILVANQPLCAFSRGLKTRTERCRRIRSF